MTTVTAPSIPAGPAPVPAPARYKTAREWLRALGNIPLDRIVFYPLPGTATLQDVIRLVDGDEKRGVELVNGTLVEKPVGLRESVIASNVNAALRTWAKPQRLGLSS